MEIVVKASTAVVDDGVNRLTETADFLEHLDRPFIIFVFQILPRPSHSHVEGIRSGCLSVVGHYHLCCAAQSRLSLPSEFQNAGKTL
jgi:hypothetical protein